MLLGRMEKARFKWRKLNGVTDVKLRDDDNLRRQIMKQWKKLAPLLDDCIPGEPSFNDLKRNREFLSFVNSIGGEIELVLFVCARGGSNIEKAVGVMDDKDNLCAICHWKAEDNSVEFKILN